MVLALLITMIILGVGITVMWVSSSGMKVSGNITRRQEALYTAEAGIERARAIIGAFTGDYDTLLRGCGTPEDDTVKGNVLCDPVSSLKLSGISLIDSSTTSASEAAPALQANAKYTVWIRNDWMAECTTDASHASKVDCDQDGTVGSHDKSQAMYHDENRRIILRAEGIGRDGLSYVAVEVVLVGAGAATGAGQYNQLGMNAQGSHSSTAQIN
jgi:hypothetical protein